MTLEQKIFSLTGNFTARYILKKNEDAKNLIILLHGYSQTAEVFYDKIKECLPPDSVVLAPNGPFPVPSTVPKDGSYRIGFSWYFHERESDDYYIDMELGQKYLKTLVEDLGFKDFPKIIVGYSQGGYIAPFAAQELKGVVQVLGINCQFLDEELKGDLPKRMDLINGDKDEVVDSVNAAASFKKLVQRGSAGKHVLVPGAGHGLSSSILVEIAQILG